MIGGGIFTIIGLTVILPQVEESGGPMWFGGLWTLLAAVGAVMGAYNFFSEEGIATEEFSVTSDPQSSTRSIQGRLKELNELKEQGLISSLEYESKRSELLNQI